MKEDERIRRHYHSWTRWSAKTCVAAPVDASGVQIIDQTTTSSYYHQPTLHCLKSCKFESTFTLILCHSSSASSASDSNQSAFMSTLEDLDDIERDEKDQRKDEKDRKEKEEAGAGANGDKDAEMKDAEENKPEEEEYPDLEILNSSTRDIINRRRLLENEMKILKSEFQRLKHEETTMKEKIKDNHDKIENNRSVDPLSPVHRY